MAAFRKRFLAVVLLKARWRGCAKGEGSTDSAGWRLGSIVMTVDSMIFYCKDVLMQAVYEYWKMLITNSLGNFPPYRLPDVFSAEQDWGPS